MISRFNLWLVLCCYLLHTMCELMLLWLCCLLASAIKLEDNNETFLFASVSSVSLISTHFIAFYSRWDWTNRKICEEMKTKELHFIACQSRCETCSVFSVQCSVKFRHNKYILIYGRRTTCTENISSTHT